VNLQTKGEDEMRVLILSNNAAGLMSLREELITALTELWEVFVCVPPDDYSKQIEKTGAKLIELSFDRRGKNIIGELSLMKNYKRLIHENNPEIVLTYTIKPNIYGGIASRLSKTPYIINVTGLGTELQSNSLFSKFLFRLYVFSARKATKVFVQNSSIKECFNKMRVIKNCDMLPGSGVNLEKHSLETYPSEDNGLRFLFIGRVMKDKGIEELIYAARKVHESHNNVTFDLIGYYDESEYKEQIDELIRLGIMKFFPFQEDIHDVIKDHHCIIHPSYHEGMSNALLEAAAVGRPVIASNIPGCKETFEDKVTGIAIKVRDKEDLVRGIEDLLSLTKSEREQMGKKGRKKVESFFDRKIIIDKYIDEIKKIEGAIG
jgi:Glycosyltransferase